MTVGLSRPSACNKLGRTVTHVRGRVAGEDMKPEAMLARGTSPWRTVQGIEFRSVTVTAWKGKQGPCFDHKQAVIYRGPFREVVDDDGHVLRRGVRTAVCEKTFRILAGEPYRVHVDLVEPRVPVSPEGARPFPCAKGALVRSPRETKGHEYDRATDAAPPVCEPGGRCC